MGRSHHEDSDNESISSRGSSRGHRPKRTHELLAAAAAFAAFHKFQTHQREQGRPVSHVLAKDLLAAFAAAEAEKLIESRGLGNWGELRDRAKELAREKSKEMYQDRYEDHSDDDDDREGHRHRHHHRHHSRHIEDLKED
ncbi:hypothetical protein DRE_00438 [Drechslerella stenobrocha 248]|uniref:CipC-like antibiotic response protein n=1 Tax=Drechslerella stenobrocha 248 TaxID=1043628 RepID=W7IEQ5_9PEZI|nr:hypothetical protein DRE_00438 [Drechslerella stenobrocha 248]